MSKRIDITEMEERLKLGLWTDNTTMDLLAELKKCYEEIDQLEARPRDDEVENYPEPDELTPSNTTRAGADWPSGPNM